MIRSIIWFFLLSLGATAYVTAEDEVVWVDEHDPAMLAAIERARASLDTFLDKYSASYPNIESYKLKVMIRDNHGTEHFWVTPFKVLEKGKFAGFLANEPALVQSVSYGELYEFSADAISDWGYVEDGVQYGSFTICVAFQSMSKEDVAYYKENYGFVCDDT